ncbi:MAG: NfeD family protein [Oscillospiraceae bacterium]|nr:NfeD family protein [Oscillospiraceae bacterium]
MGGFYPGTPGFWLIGLAVLLLIEAAVPGLVSIWFALGALAALLAALCGASGPIQIVLFVVVSMAALVVTRPLVKKYVNAKVQHTNADRILGQECVVTEQVDNLAGTGEISVDGKRWTARSSDLAVIPQGSRVTVERIEGVKAIVKIQDGSGR